MTSARHARAEAAVLEALRGGAVPVAAILRTRRPTFWLRHNVFGALERLERAGRVRAEWRQAWPRGRRRVYEVRVTWPLDTALRLPDDERQFSRERQGIWPPKEPEEVRLSLPVMHGQQAVAYWRQLVGMPAALGGRGMVVVSVDWKGEWPAAVEVTLLPSGDDPDPALDKAVHRR